MVYSIEAGQTYVHQYKTTVTYGYRKYVMQYAEAVTYMGKIDAGQHIFLQADKTSLSLSSLINIFPYYVGEDIYVHKPRIEPKFFR